jgi:hypothetical protein
MDFKTLGPPQFYPPGDVPVVLLARDLDDALKRRISKNMFFKLDAAELEDLRERIPKLVRLEQAAV